MDRLKCCRARATLIHRRPCGNPQCWLRPSPAPRRSPERQPIRTVTPSIATAIVPASGSSRYCPRVLRWRDPRRRTAPHRRPLEQTAVHHYGCDCPSFFNLPAPAKQLLRRQSVPPCHPRTTADLNLRDYPRRVILAPRPPSTCAGETSSRRTGLVIALSTVAILS